MRFDPRRGLVWLAPLLTVLGGAPAAAEWSFQIPAGWVDLSPGKPVPPGIPVPEVARSGACRAYAVDPAGARDGYRESMAAFVLPAPVVVDEADFGQILTGLEKGVHRTAPNARVSIVEQGIVEIQGVPSIRVVAEATAPDRHLRLMQYVIPGGNTTATVAYTADASAFARYLPVFEANARTVQGAAIAPLGARVGHWLRGTWLGDLSPHDRDAIFRGVGELTGFIVVLVLFRLVQKRRSAGGPEMR